MALDDSALVQADSGRHTPRDPEDVLCQARSLDLPARACACWLVHAAHCRRTTTATHGAAADDEHRADDFRLRRRVSVLLSAAGDFLWMPWYLYEPVSGRDAG